MTKQAFTKPRPSPGKVIESFGDTTSAHGVPKIIGATSAISAFLWTVVTLVALGMFCYQGGTLVISFFHWPFTTQVDVVTLPTLRYPSISICNMNKLRRSKLVDTRYAGLIELDGGIRDSSYSWWFDWSSAFYDDWRFNYFSSSYDFQGGGIPDYPSPVDSAPFPTYDPASLTSISNRLLIENETVMPTDYPSFGDYSSSTPGIRKKRSFRRFKRQLMEMRKRKRRDTTFDGSESSSSSSSSSSYSHYYDSFYNIFSTWQDSWRGEFNYYEYYDFTGVTDDSDWQAFYDSLLQSGDFSQFKDIVTSTREEVENLGHQANDFILQCTFDKKKCNTSDFMTFQNNIYGNCFAFNHAYNGTVPRISGKTGAQHGLHLTLFVEQPEYVGLLTPETGVRITINDPYIIPYPEDDGFTIPTGVSASIGIRQSYIERLPVPHGNCTNGEGSNFNVDSYYHYSRRACLKHCFQEHIEDKCGCVTNIMEDKPLCSVLNSTQQKCKQLADTLFQEDKLDCNCPTPCSEYGYRKTVSSSIWPSERYEPHLVETLSRINSKIEQVVGDVTLTRQNLVQLKIYFEELNYESIIQKPLYTVEGLLGGVGGLMGLYVGLSVISLFEIVVFFVRFCRASWWWMTRREKVKPIITSRDEELPDYNYGYKGTGLL